MRRLSVDVIALAVLAFDLRVVFFNAFLVRYRPKIQGKRLVGLFVPVNGRHLGTPDI